MTTATAIQESDLNQAAGPRVLLFFLQRLLFRRSYEFIEPLGLMTLAAYIEERGYRPGVFSGTVTEGAALLEREMERRLVAAVGLYCDFENRSVVEPFCRWIKDRWGLPVVVGGPQAVALHEDFLSQSGCDAVAIGEGEATLQELLDCLIRGQGALGDIDGIAYLDDHGCLVRTPERRLIAHLDELPYPRMAHSLTGVKNNLSILSGRGCPFQCAFCYEGGKQVRLRSVDHVMGEIRHGLRENPHVRYIWFADDTFTLQRERTAHFCRELAELRKEYDFVWFCEGHPSTLVRSPGLIDEMVEAGLARMQIGIETGSARLMDTYNKRTTPEQIEAVVRRCRDAGLKQLCGNIIIGGAHETDESLAETWAYVDKLLTLAPGMLDISLTLFMPFPETAITRCPKQFGMTVLDGEALTSVGDYPVAHTEAMDLPAIAMARKDFQLKVLHRMRELLAQGRVSHQAILDHYRLHAVYGISSVWHETIYAKQPFLHRRYTMLARTSARTSAEIPPGEWTRWRPQRVFSLWNAIAWEKGYPEVLGEVLSPLEYHLLLHCSGKLQVGQLTGVALEQFPGRYDSREEAEALIQKVLRSFEEKHWLVFHPD
ncbi:radical SAM protein [Heliobacterium undosum]|uniref:Radical SAM protein n=1 Tax=Heliomicrobium undosum TaxID=121734 RepID=A0A845L6Z1_9FIRM|nr:radical SAM protein [Heliomicrobium undosum]MZP30584.1 radical SAM protein [Heliomicrobium undosum]